MSSKKTHLSTTGAWIWHPTGAVPEPISDNAATSESAKNQEATSQDTVKGDISDMNAEGGK